MSELIFLYECNSFKIQYHNNEKMKDIFKKFTLKAHIDNNSVYYLYMIKQVIIVYFTFFISYLAYKKALNRSD